MLVSIYLLEYKFVYKCEYINVKGYSTNRCNIPECYIHQRVTYIRVLHLTSVHNKTNNGTQIQLVLYTRS